MFRILLLLFSSAAFLSAATRPFVEIDGERQTVVSVVDGNSVVLEDGRLVKVSRAKLPLLLEMDESFEASSVTVSLLHGPELLIVDDVRWSPVYQFKATLSEPVELFGVLIRTDEKSNKVTIPVAIVLGVDGEEASFFVTADPFPVLGDILKTEPGNFYYEFRLFTKGREILVEGEGWNRLLVDWRRFESTEDSKPEIVLPVGESFLHYRKSDAEALVEFVIDENGKTRNVRVVRKSAGWFAEPAKKMVEMTRFYPIIKDGKPTPATVKIPLYFKSQK